MAFEGNDSPQNSDHAHDNGFERHDDGFKIGIILCLSIAAVVGFLGNGLVVAVILRAKKLKSVMNRFILHLAVSDMIVSVLAIPLFLFVNFNNGLTNDTKSLTVCKLARFFQYLSPEASMTLLITIGWNRHQAVVHPLNIMTYGTANKLIIAAWLYAIVVVSPSLYLTKLGPASVDPATNESLTYCATIPATTMSGLVYVMFLGLVGYIIPLASLIILYGKIYKTVWRRKSAQLGESRPVEAFIRSRKKVLKMFLTVIFVFLLTWVPLLLYISAIEWTIHSTSSRVDYARLITYSLGLCNSVCNPFIYALFNAKFRDGCKEMCTLSFKAIWRRKSPADGNAASSGPALQPKGAVLSRRGGFHGTKGDEKKKSEKKTVEINNGTTAPQSRANKVTPESIGRQIARRLRSMTDVEAVPKDSTEAVQLVCYQRTVETAVETDDIVLHFPRSESSQEKTNSSLSNCTNCLILDDSVFNESSESDGTSDFPEKVRPNQPNGRTEDRTEDRTEERMKVGYSILEEDQGSSFAPRRTQSEGLTADRNTTALEEARVRSMSAKL